jgi:hypothetical protein
MLLMAALGLAGCASSTKLYTNDKMSDTVKAKSFKAYKEVLLFPPKEDPRTIVPRVVSEISAMGFLVRLMDPSKPIEAPQGTGFVVGSAGWLLTCAHVIGENKQATITLAGKRLIADVVKSDEKADLALLKLRDPLPDGAVALAFRPADQQAVMGEEVSTVGYPLSRMLGNSARMTRGLLSATAGLKDNENEVQVSAEIQPGNSGGPLFDRDGNVIGVVNRTINPSAVVEATGGALPQNINFAIKGRPVLDFLKGADEQAYAALSFAKGGGLASVSKGVAKVQAGIVETENVNDKMVVRFNYVSRWDLWYRFRLFVLAAFDYETQESLFVAGQGRDNMISNEDVVIRDTMTQFRTALQAR